MDHFLIFSEKKLCGDILSKLLLPEFWKISIEKPVGSYFNQIAEGRHIYLLV